MAGIEISALPAVAAALLTDVMPVDQLPGPVTYKETNAQILELFTDTLGISGIPANGELPIGNGANFTLATITAGTGITISNGAGSISIATNGDNPWVDQTTASVTMAANTGYTSDAGATLITFTLPASSEIGDWVEINGKGSGGWTIAQAAGQLIHVGNSASTLGALGSVSSTNQYDSVKLRCLTANTIWAVASQQSSGLTIV
jgi:hypothetical protein